MGLTPSGYVPTTPADEVALLNAKVLANMGASLGLSPDGNLGQLIAIFAEKCSQLTQLGAAVYAAADPAQAAGALLANVAAISGTRPQIATYSKVAGNLVLAANTTAPAGSVASVTGQPANTWVLLADVVSGAAGAYPGTFRSSQPGPFVANAGTLTVIATPVIGWTSVTNPADAVAGLPGDSDASLRARREAELAAAGADTLPATRAAVLEVPGVIQAFVFQNTSPVTDANGLPPKSFRVVIWDGPGMSADNAAVAAAIMGNSPAGIPSFGSTSVTLTDDSGDPKTISFTRATQLRTYVACTTTPSTLTTDQTNAVKGAIAAYAMTAFGLGSGVIARAFSASPLEATAVYSPVVTDVPAFAFDTHSTPTNTANLPGSPLTIFEVATSDILVNGI